MPIWLWVLAVIVILAIGLVWRVRRPSRLDLLQRELAEAIRGQDMERALAVAEEQVQVAEREVEEWTRNLGSHHTNLMVAGRLAGSLEMLGRVQFKLGSEEEAEKSLARAVNALEESVTRDRLVEVEEGPDPSHPALAEALGELSSFYSQTGREQESLTTIRRAIEVLDENLGGDHPLSAGCRVQEADCLKHLGSLNEAESIYRRAIGLLEPVAGGDEEYSYDLVAAYNNLGQMYGGLGRVHEAVANLRNALDVAVQELGSDHPLVEPIRCSLEDFDDGEGARAP